MPRCSDPGCLEFRFDSDAALREGWSLIDDEPYCPLHHSGASWRAKKAAERDELKAQMERQRALHNRNAAVSNLSPDDYRAWDEFQSDLAAYHKEHGRLAHSALRLLDHRQWLQTYRATGRIDVAEATRFTEAAEKVHKSDRERLARGI